MKPDASARSLSDDKDEAERKSIAKQLAATAKAWKESTLLAICTATSRSRPCGIARKTK